MMSESKVDATSPSVTTVPASSYTSPPSRPGPSLSLGYFRTGPGIVKLVELFLGILCMACAAPAWTDGTHWFLFVVVTAFVATSLWCFIYLFSLREAINLPIDWLLTELILTAIFAVLYLIGSIVQISTTVTKPRPPPRLSPYYITAGELLNTCITTVLYLIAVIVQFCSIGVAPGRNITAGVFGVFNMLTYTVGSFYLYRDWKDSHPNSSFSGSVLRRNP